MKRRNIIKAFGVAAGATFLPELALETKAKNPNKSFLDEIKATKLAKPVTAITLGAGSRGNVYGGFAVAFPDQLDIVGVAEPIQIRNDRYTKKHAIPEANRFKTWEDVFKRPKFADAIIITTPDHLHYGPCMAALKLGYDILLEKPVAPTEAECREILALAKQTGRIVGVCHVLRYAPYFVKMKELIQSGAVGELVSIQHLEPIDHVHMAHSYVRGNWHDKFKTTPILLAKSCHDLDIIRWLADSPCKQIVGMGGLKWFKKENTPKGSTERCGDGCAIESTCPYSAQRIYYRERSWLHVFDLPEEKEKQGDAILQLLKTTDYGRCVYKMDNNQDDHYSCSMEFENGVTASFAMEAFTSYGGRRTRIMGSMGDIVGDMETMTHTDFRTKKVTTYDNSNIVDVENYKGSGHGGGDWRLASNWALAVSTQDASKLSSSIDASIESHIMGFMSEESRKTLKVTSVKL
ncbi:MAG: Gfo/Idh/MocA family oxidoreductase [Bacteroidota bacterium]|nr:Gfo/Idh/MocA family oxidoreductase [Bacteroidota bacterium]